MKNVPEHVAIIMDGNGRWAKARRHNRFFGHIRGAKVAKSIIERASKLGIKYLTLFTFSNENWNRPDQEVNFLMKLLIKRLDRERESLVGNNIRFRIIGDPSRLPEKVKEAVEKTVEATRNCDGMTLIFALSYGGRQDILKAVQKITQNVINGRYSPEEISEKILSDNLDTAFMPDPDLIIRTSGEQRLSNFLLWQSEYSEFYFTPKHWPDFEINDFQMALDNFKYRERRFGKTGQQVQIEDLKEKAQI